MANRYAPVPPEATTVELYATPNWMVVPGAHRTDSCWSGGFCWFGSASEMGFAGSCGDAAAEMTARKTDRIAVLINAPLRYPRPANAAHRRHCEALLVKPAQGIRHRRHQVRATAQRLGDEHLRPAPLGQPLGCLHQRIEPAAKAAARDFLRCEPLRAQHRRVHQVAPLVVGDGDRK